MNRNSYTFSLFCVELIFPGKRKTVNRIIDIGKNIEYNVVNHLIYKNTTKGAFRLSIKIAATWVACKNRQTIYTTHPTPSNFLNSVLVIVFQIVIVYLKSDTAYPLNLKKYYMHHFFPFRTKIY